MSSSGDRPCVLLVDDDSAVRRALYLLVDSLGWDAIEAGDASQALKCLQERPYDLAIIDIKMPDTNGIELCRLIHLNTAHPVPVVIILSGYVDSTHREAALTAGAAAILEKPIGRDELREAMRKHGLPCKS
jgi:CheY-like chemotaxis protein